MYTHARTVEGVGFAWTPGVCKMRGLFWRDSRGLGPLFTYYWGPACAVFFRVRAHKPVKPSAILVQPAATNPKP